MEDTTPSPDEQPEQENSLIDSNGKYLSLSKSALRAFILALVGLLNQWSLPVLQNPVIAVIVITIIFSGSLAFLYGLIFNRKTRQGPHDLIAGSYVIKAPLLKIGINNWSNFPNSSYHLLETVSPSFDKLRM